MISIVVAVYNVEKYIKALLDSITSQDYHDFEIIFVNDGSKDRSKEIIEEYYEGKDYLWQIIDQENKGQSSARNVGLKAAKGDYVVFLDSDDVISSNFLSVLLSGFEKDIDFSFCNFSYVKKQVPIVSDDQKFKDYSKDELLEAFLKREINFLVVSMMFRRSFLLDNNLFFDEEIRFSEDQIYIWNAIFKSRSSKYFFATLYGYYLRENSIMTGSPYQKISKGFEVYQSFTSDLKDKYPKYQELISMILPRWELGTLYSSAKLLTKEEYQEIYQKMEGKKILSKIKGIKEMKAYLLGFVSFLSCSLLYFLCRKMVLE